MIRRSSTGADVQAPRRSPAQHLRSPLLDALFLHTGSGGDGGMDLRRNAQHQLAGIRLPCRAALLLARGDTAIAGVTSGILSRERRREPPRRLGLALGEPGTRPPRAPRVGLRHDDRSVAHVTHGPQHALAERQSRQHRPPRQARESARSRSPRGGRTTDTSSPPAPRS